MNGLEKVPTIDKDFYKYEKLTPEIIKESKSLSNKIKKNKKIIHINSTQLGGGVSELLKSQIPLERSLGLDSNWYIIKAPTRFFEITKQIHNFLQGEKGNLDESERDFYLEWIHKQIAPSFKQLIDQEKPDIVIIHDPQPLPLIDYFPKNIVSILRMHIDLSNPNIHILDFLLPLIEKYQLTIYSHPDYCPNCLNNGKTEIIMPAIDPFNLKNKTMEKSKAERILSLYNIHPDYPIISQVSRFDPWKDPLGTLEAYYLAKNKIDNLQLIMAGIFQAYDDPEAIEVFKKVEKQAQGDPNIFLFADPKKLKDIGNDSFINAIYTASDVIIQKSIKEGFGLVVTEAMWKGKPVIGGKAKGIALQIKHDENGFLVDSAEQAGQWAIRLLKDKNLREEIGQAAHESVKNNFLLSRYILDHLKIYYRFI